MKRAAVLVLFMVFLLSACIPGLPTQQAAEEPLPSVDAQATNEAMSATEAAETLNSIPTATLEPTETPEPTATLTATLTATETATETATTDPNATATETLTPDPNATATETLTPDPNATSTATATATVTGTPPTPTPTETLHVRYYGTLPPAIPYAKVILVNRSKAEAYISLDCTTVDGYNTILEYPVSGRRKVNAPVGQYTYVAWVGGRQFQGWFGLGRNEDIEITLYKDKITIK